MSLEVVISKVNRNHRESAGVIVAHQKRQFSRALLPTYLNPSCFDFPAILNQRPSGWQAHLYP